MASASLSFTLRVARSPLELEAACVARSLSYGHHLPALKQPFASPDPVDMAPGTAVLVCTDKRSGHAVGTARVQVSTHGPLLIEQAIELPEAMAGHARAEITRLSAVPGADPLVKLALWKAAWLYCQAAQVRWMVIGARRESLVRQYRRLGFVDLHADGRCVPLAYAGGVPHRVLVFDSMTAERAWHAAKNGLYGFMIDTLHPDIDLFAPPPLNSVLLQQQAHLGRAFEAERGAGGPKPGQAFGQRRVASGGREIAEQTHQRAAAVGLERALPAGDHAELICTGRQREVVGQVDAADAGIEVGEQTVHRLSEAFVVSAGKIGGDTRAHQESSMLQRCVD